MSRPKVPKRHKVDDEKKEIVYKNLPAQYYALCKFVVNDLDLNYYTIIEAVNIFEFNRFMILVCPTGKNFTITKNVQPNTYFIRRVR